jgi:hypothetical protein
MQIRGVAAWSSGFAESGSQIQRFAGVQRAATKSIDPRSR